MTEEIDAILRVDDWTSDLSREERVLVPQTAVKKPVTRS